MRVSDSTRISDAVESLQVARRIDRACDRCGAALFTTCVVITAQPVKLGPNGVDPADYAQVVVTCVVCFNTHVRGDRIASPIARVEVTE